MLLVPHASQFGYNSFVAVTLGVLKCCGVFAFGFYMRILTAVVNLLGCGWLGNKSSFLSTAIPGHRYNRL